MNNSKGTTDRKIQGNFGDIKNKTISIFSVFLLLVSIILASAALAQAATLSLSWNPNNEDDLAGYKLYYDNKLEGDFQNVVDVGMVTEYEITNLPCGDTYRIALSAYDVYDNESELSETISVSIPQPDFKIETGEISINHDWIRVTYNQPFTDPVIVANCPSNNDDSPVTIRIRNIDKDGFDIRLQEWEYLEQPHEEEVVSYLVVERGHFILDDGTVLESGSFTIDNTDSFETISFCQSFNQLPVIMTSVVSTNEPEAVVCRVDNINLSGFDFLLQEQELDDQIHAGETISFIAWEPSQGSIDGLKYEIGRDSDLTENFSTISFNETYSAVPHVLASLQTINGSDPANLRYQNKDVSGIELKITEEQSSDSEMTHAAEDVGFMIFAAEPPANDEHSTGDDTAVSAGGGTETPDDGGATTSDIGTNNDDGGASSNSNTGTTSGDGGTTSGDGGTGTGSTTNSTGGGGNTGTSSNSTNTGSTTNSGGNTSTSDKSVNLFNSTLDINSGDHIDVTIDGGTEPYVVTSTNDAVATATIDGSTMTITGMVAGTATLTITDAKGNSGHLVVNVKTAATAKGNPNTPMTPVELGTTVNPTHTHLDVAQGKVTIAPQLMVADEKSVAFPIMLIWIPEAGMGFNVSKLTTTDYHNGVLTITLGTIDFSGYAGTYDIFYGYIDVDGNIHYNAYELSIQ